jgi:hypothetical protein
MDDSGGTEREIWIRRERREGLMEGRVVLVLDVKVMQML